MASETTIAMLEDYILSVQSGQYSIGYPGRSDGAGGWEIEVPNDPGRWWVRLWANGEFTGIDKATPLGVPRDPQMRCLLLRINQELCLWIPDPTSLRQLYGFRSNDAASNQAPTIGNTELSTDVGIVAPSAAGGMNVRVSAYPAGGLLADVDPIDLTADEPGSSNQYLWDVSYIDTDGSVKWAQSTARTLAGVAALPIEDALAVSIPANAYRLWAVSLGNGQANASASRLVNLQNDLNVSVGAGANTALSNLASVAINTSLIDDTDNTDDLGSSSILWRLLYAYGWTGKTRSAPSTPSSGYLTWYAGTDKHPHAINADGTDFDLGAAASSGVFTAASSVTIPGLAANADISGAGGGGTIGIEFDSSGDTPTWSPSSPATVDANTTDKSHLYARSTDTTERFGVWAWTPGSGAFEAITKIDIGDEVAAGTTSTAGAGLHIQDGANSNRLLLQIFRNGVVYTVAGYTYTSGTYTQRGSSITPLGNSIYLKISRDGSNNVSFWWSASGKVGSWNLIATQAFTLTIADIGFRMISANANYSFLSDFLRTTV